jgi:hypothetical protein
MMKEKINDRLGSEVVREIVLKSGKVNKPEMPPPEEPHKKKRLSTRQLAFIDEQAAAITDPETREMFAALMRASLES